MGWPGASGQELEEASEGGSEGHRRQGVNVKLLGVTFKSLMSFRPRSSLSSLVMQYRIFSTWKMGTGAFRSCHYPSARGRSQVGGQGAGTQRGRGS